MPDTQHTANKHNNNKLTTSSNTQLYQIKTTLEMQQPDTHLTHKYTRNTQLQHTHTATSNITSDTTATTLNRQQQTHKNTKQTHYNTK